MRIINAIRLVKILIISVDADTYYLSYSTGGSFPGTYTIINTGRTGSCSNILTATFCSNDTLSHTAEVRFGMH